MSVERTTRAASWRRCPTPLAALLCFLTLAGCTRPTDSGPAEPNQPPVALIASHDALAPVTIGGLETFTGAATDPDDAASELSVTWFLGTEATCIGTAEPDGSTSCIATINPGTSWVTLEVRDPDGLLDSQTVTLRPTTTGDDDDSTGDDDDATSGDDDDATWGDDDDDSTYGDDDDSTYGDDDDSTYGDDDDSTYGDDDDSTYGDDDDSTYGDDDDATWGDDDDATWGDDDDATWGDDDDDASGPWEGACAGMNLGSGYVDGSSMGGRQVAMRFDNDELRTVTRVEVFTGEQTGPNTLSIYTHDGGSEAPGLALSSGTFRMDSAVGWQGADLTAPVLFGRGQSFWVVWDPIGGAQTPLDTGGTDVTYRGSDDGVSWDGPFSGPWKFRFFCADTSLGPVP